MVDGVGEWVVGMRIKKVVCVWGFRVGVRYGNWKMRVWRLVR